MALSSSGCTHLGASDNQKRWLVVGIALNKILVPQIRPFVEQEVDKEYNNLKTSHNIHTQSTSGRLQRWPARKFLKYENINGNSLHPKLPGGKYNISLFDCRVLSHIDFAKLYVENFMAKFNAFDDHCDASAVLTLLGGVPVFSAAVEAAAGDVRSVRNDWAHCVFSKWDPVKFQQSFVEMEHLVRVLALPAAHEAKLLVELKDWETKGTLLCMNSPVDPALLQLVQQEVKFLQDSVNNLSVEFDQEKVTVQQQLQEMKQMVERLKTFQEDADQRFGLLETRTGQVEDRVHSLEEDTAQRFGNVETRTGQVEDQVHILEEDTAQRFGNLETRTGQVEDQVHSLEGDTTQRFGDLETRTGQVEDQVHSLEEKFHDLKSRESALSNASLQDPLMTSDVIPEKLVELIRRDYKGAVLCPFPWCEDDLQLKLSNIFTRLQIVSRRKERSQLTDVNVNMTEIFKSHPECHNPRVVLIEGNPGMGKTTYCQKLAHDWSLGEIPPDASFPGVEILLLLKCRDMHMKTANIEEAIDDQLLPQDAGKKEKEDFFHCIRSNQSKILLILDGLDELRHELLPCIQPLIQGKIFSNTFLVLTARHEAGIRLRRYCDTLLEIIGYTNDDVDSYVKKYFSKHEDQSLAGKMIQQLKINTKLRELTANPLNTALLCLLCEETKGIFPSNRTKIYDDLVSCALRRYFTKRGVPLSDDDPLERCSEQLIQLGEMAFEALLKNELYFSCDEKKCQSPGFLQLPFLSREPSVSKIKPKPCYAFTHKTFQEYFAAFYLVQQIITGNKGTESLLAQLSPVDNWQVWEFLITMSSSKKSEMAVFVVSCLCSFFFQDKPRMTIDAVADANVSRELEVCELKPFDWTRVVERWTDGEKILDDVVTKTLHVIKECEDDGNELQDYQRKMVHILAQCFPVTKLSLGQLDRYHVVYSEYLKTNYTLTALSLHDRLNDVLLATIEGAREKNLEHLNLLSVNTDFFLMKLCSYPFLKEDSEEKSFPFSFKNKAIASFTHQQSWIKNFGAKALGKCLQSFRHLTHLKFRGDFICIEGAVALAEVIRANRSLTHLCLRGAGISDLEVTVIANALQSNCTLTHLSLAQNQIHGLGAIVLANSLNSNRSLQYVDLSDNDVGDSGAQELARILRSNSSLTFLDLGKTSSSANSEKPVVILDSDFEIRQHLVRGELIGASGASSLARALRSNRSLTYLDLSFNEIWEAGFAALGEVLQANCTLSHLFLCGNAMGDSGTASLGEGLKLNRSLTRLYLTENGIGDPGAEALGKAMQSNHSLTHLNLQVNLIGDLGAAALASALESTGIQLTHLDLALNKISCVGAEALAKALESNSSLKALELGSNAIGSSGASSFGKALRSNRTLTHLIVTSNNITESGAVELVDALLINNSLICLNAEDNPISSLEADNLKRDIQSHCVIFI